MFYSISKFFINIYMKIFFLLKVEGVENIPKDGGLVLCSNHISNYDPVALAAAINRRIYFLAKKELFSVKVLGWYLRVVDMIPVDRNKADMNAFREGLKVLKNENVLGIFAEGTRNKTGEMGNAKAGVALFALKGKANVLPVYISGEYKYFSPIRVRIGKAIDLSEFKGVKADTEILNQVTEKIMVEVRKLK